jgi:hypothetical protein
MCGRKPRSKGGLVRERGLVFARFFLWNLGKAASDGDFLLLFSKKRRREIIGELTNLSDVKIPGQS